MTDINIKEPEVLITRLFNAAPELVFKAWSDAEQLKRWYAPQDCSMPFCSVDFREGGTFHHCIRTPQGDCWCIGRYLKIISSKSIVYTLGFSDEAGNFVDTSPVGKHSAWPLETIVTVTFSEQGGKTLVTLHQSVPEALARKTGAYPSWLQMLDNLARNLA